LSHDSFNDASVRRKTWRLKSWPLKHLHSMIANSGYCCFGVRFCYTVNLGNQYNKIRCLL
jgi:hypothetical protein